MKYFVVTRGFDHKKDKSQLLSLFVSHCWKMHFSWNTWYRALDTIGKQLMSNGIVPYTVSIATIHQFKSKIKTTKLKQRANSLFIFRSLTEN